MQAQPAAYPLSLDLDAPLEVARWRPLVHWLLAIPHFFMAYLLMVLRGILQFLSFFTILFTKEIPRSFFDLIAMTFRYQWRITTYMLFMRETYPPFEFEPRADDDGHDPAVFSIEYPTELNRFLPLVKWFLAIPHYFVMFVYGIGMLFAWIASFFAVLFTGRYPEGIRSYIIKVVRYGNRVFAYVGLLRDEYPPFGLS